MRTVLDGKGAAQPAVVAPARVGADETRLEDVDGDRLHAQHNDLVEPAWPAVVVELDTHAPRSPARIRSAQRDPGVSDQVWAQLQAARRKQEAAEKAAKAELARLEEVARQAAAEEAEQEREQQESLKRKATEVEVDDAERAVDAGRGTWRYIGE